jgi:hypothetical protein
MSNKAQVTVLLLISMLSRFIWIFFFEVPPTPLSDEAVYITAAHQILRWVEAGRLQLTPGLQYNLEHPMFAKMLFAFGIWATRGGSVPGLCRG